MHLTFLNAKNKEDKVTTLKNIFEKDISRNIECVIKADDEASLRIELEEYVLTNEVEKRLEDFLSAYNDYQGANGVWVSGFFGSGKSHLLKILALILENREVDGTPAMDLFLPKCGDNKILEGDLKRAVSIPSKSILFNIDQKADIISKTQTDALLAVFAKVFDEMCGYYGKQGHIAQFERELDSRHLYEKFKTAYAEIANKTWQQGREQAILESNNIAKAYALVTDGDENQAKGILDKYRSQYRLSIEDFAEQVNDYIERQAPNFRLNFFVDEVGQYIANNVKLMTNLQTVAESLATKCKGRAWIIVTAQEEMSNVVGEMGKQQSDDFSKIQARFANRMKLTSADVAEVIQKRLLTKTEDATKLLSDIYDEQSNNFKTLFDFADGSHTYRNFHDSEHFINCYPFIPYQFALFQSSIQNLSLHNAFEGKHSSVGERSMLGVFQDVAKQIGNHKLGQLATFDLMFEGISKALKSTIQRAIIQATNHLGHPFAIQLLKTLFLVKYVKEFKPTVRNLCVLMLNDFQQDLSELKKQIEEALNLLEQQTYIQRNGDLYEYLSDEEKDIEQEIKNTEVETSDVAAELEKIIFDNIIKHRKIRYEIPQTPGQGHDYPFSRKLDDRLIGRDHELAIHVVSPFHQHAENEQMLRTNSTYNTDELFVILPADERLMSDLIMYKQTDKYIRQNISITQQEAIKRILADKTHQNQERYDELLQRAQRLIGKAKLLVAGVDIEITSEDAQTRVVRGFHELIARAYPNLRMLRGISYTEEMIKNILNNKGDTLFGTDETSLAESEQELLAFIQSNKKEGIRTTIKTLLERFGCKPYGWYYAAVLCLLANLYARGKVEARANGNLLDEEELEKALRNTQTHGNIIVEPQVAFTASQVRNLKEFFNDFFDASPAANEAKALGQETGVAIKELTYKLTPLLAQVSNYPFLNALTPVLDRLKEIGDKPYTWYLTEIPRLENELLDMKEEVIDPLRKFMSGSQKNIYDNARHFLQSQEPNFNYLEGEEYTDLASNLNDPDCFKGNRMQQLKTQIEHLQEKVASQIDHEISKAKEVISSLNERLCNAEDFNALDDAKQNQLTKPFIDFSAEIEKQKLIAVIRDNLRRFQDNDYPRLLSQMTAWAHPPAATPQTPSDSGDSDAATNTTQTTLSEKTIQYISRNTLKISFNKAYLADEKDVDDYLESVRKALIEEITKGKRIQI